MSFPTPFIAIGLALVGYVVIDTQKGVTVYKHNGGSGIDLAAEGDIDAPPEKVRAVLLDYARKPPIVKDVKETRILERDANSMLVYQRLSLPVISDRDYTLRVRWGSDGTTLWTKFTTENEHGPAPIKGVVRTPVNEGGWRLEPIKGGAATHAHYQFKMDLGGSLPGWMGKSQAGKDIPELFEGFRKAVQ